MLCPICKLELKMTGRQGIEIDYCPQCRGVWLDRGELDKLIERAAGASPQAAPPPPPMTSPDPAYSLPGSNHTYGASATYPAYMPPPPRRYDDDDDDYDDDDRNRYRNQPHPFGQPGPYRKKREGFLGDLFDFD